MVFLSVTFSHQVLPFSGSASSAQSTRSGRITSHGSAGTTRLVSSLTGNAFMTQGNVHNHLLQSLITTKCARKKCRDYPSVFTRTSKLPYTSFLRVALRSGTGTRDDPERRSCLCLLLFLVSICLEITDRFFRARLKIYDIRPITDYHVPIVVFLLLKCEENPHCFHCTLAGQISLTQRRSVTLILLPFRVMVQ